MSNDLDKISFSLGELAAEARRTNEAVIALHRRMDEFSRDQVKRDEFLTLNAKLLQHMENEAVLHNHINVTLAQHEGEIEEHSKTLENHGKTISEVKGFKNKAIGWAAGISVGGGLSIPYLQDFFKFLKGGS